MSINAFIRYFSFTGHRHKDNFSKLFIELQKIRTVPDEHSFMLMSLMKRINGDIFAGYFHIYRLYDYLFKCLFVLCQLNFSVYR